MLTLTEIIIALVIGGGTGLILQRGRVCANTGFRNIFLANNIDIAGIFFIAIAVEMVGYFLLSFIDLFSFVSNPISLSSLLMVGKQIKNGCAYEFQNIIYRSAHLNSCL